MLHWLSVLFLAVCLNYFVLLFVSYFLLAKHFSSAREKGLVHWHALLSKLAGLLVWGLLLMIACRDDLSQGITPESKEPPQLWECDRKLPPLATRF